MNKCKQDCNICNQKYYLYWTKQDFIDFIDFFRWKEIAVMAPILGFCFLVWGFWGLVISWFVFQLFQSMGGGTMIYFVDEPTPLPCSKGIKGCCGNGYSHEWNVAYQSKLKWYERCF